MGMLRSINSPGVEVVEVDLSDYVSLVGGTTSLVLGFSPQGQSGVPVQPTSTSSVKSYFGTPKTEAERYFYYACKEVFDKGGRLIAARIPYNNNAQYLTPAVSYDIEEWQTTHVNSFGDDAKYDETELCEGKTTLIINTDSETMLTVNKSQYSHFEIFNGIMANPKKLYKWSNSGIYSAGTAVSYPKTYTAYNAASSYTKGDYVSSADSVEGSIFECMSASLQGVTPPTSGRNDYWKQVDPNDYYTSNIKNTGKTPGADNVSVWSSSNSYSINELVKLGENRYCSLVSNNKFPIYADSSTVTEWSSSSTYAASAYVKITKTADEQTSVTYFTALTSVVPTEYDPKKPGTDGGFKYWKNVELESKWASVTAFSDYWTKGSSESNVRVISPTLKQCDDPQTEVVSSGTSYTRVDMFMDSKGNKVELDYDNLMKNRIVYVTLTNAGRKAYGDYLYMDPDDVTDVEVAANAIVLSSDKYFEAFYYTKPSFTVIDGKEFTGTTVINGCVYNKVKKYPVLTVVNELTRTGTQETVGVQMFYANGRAVYPNCTDTDFIEYILQPTGENALKVEAPNGPGLKYLPGKVAFTPQQIAENVKWLDSAQYFMLKRKQFTEKIENSTVKLPDFFESAPVTADVTTGDEEYSAALAISALPEGSTWAAVSASYPQLSVEDPYGDEHYRYVASVIPSKTYSYSERDFFEFVSPFTSIQEVAEAGSQNYKWIRWTRNAASASTSSEAESAYVDTSSLIVSRTVGCRLGDVPNGLANIENLVTVKPNTDHFGFITLSSYQDYRDGAKKVDANKIVICNINEKQFGKDAYNNGGMECLGVMPILIGGLQAVPRQQLVSLPSDIGNGRLFNAIDQAVRGSLYDNNVPESDGVDCKYASLSKTGFYKTLSNVEKFNAFESTVSNDLLAKVPTIQLDQSLRPNATAKNMVTLVVCELAISKSFDNKVYVNVLESFTGSLDRNAVDSSNKSLFIDSIVNSEDSGSSYVRMFSNYVKGMSAASQKTLFEESYRVTPTEENTAVVCVPASLGSQNWFVKDKESMSLGFTEEQTKKYIAYSTIAGTVEGVFDTLSNIDETEIDVVVDAGLSTIANRIKNMADDDPNSVKFEYDVFWERITSVDRAAGWKAICAKYITFCSSTRKDCLCVVDAPRNVTVKDSVKLVQPGGKYSVDFDVIPMLNYISGLNSSYCGQYLNWISYVDDFSGKTVWLPPSIAANGAIVYTNYNYQYFDAPAGTRRGRVTAGIDVAINPTAAQQDIIYGRSWNYYISTTSDGIVLWGQKTSQSRSSALDRLNVRMLMLRLERLTRKAMKQFIFEGNTEKLRNKVVDTLTPIYENCKANGGLIDYRIVCDERTNTTSTIDNNELRVAIGVKPTKTAEFIHCTWFIMSTGADFAEMESYF